MRVFIAANSYRLDTDFQAARITVQFASGSHQSSLLMMADEPAAILEKFIRGQRMVSGTAFTNYEKKWVYADFQMTYDPCACNFRSRLYINLDLIKNAQINMVGLSQGTLMSINNAAGTVNQENSKWTLQNAINSGTKASETFNSIGDFTNKQLNELKNHGNASKTQLPDSVSKDKTKALNWFQNVMRSGFVATVSLL
jgi:hypothetical protein